MGEKRDDEFATIRMDIAEIKEIVTDLKISLQGSPSGAHGLCYRVNQLEQSDADNRKFRWTFAGIVSVGCPFVWMLIQKYILGQ